MTIKKNELIGKLKTSIVEMCSVYVILPKGYRMSVCQVNGQYLEAMLRDNPNERGMPRLAALDRDTGRSISVFPRADKRYRLRVVGTQFIEQ